MYTIHWTELSIKNPKRKFPPGERRDPGPTNKIFLVPSPPSPKRFSFFGRDPARQETLEETLKEALKP
jgi:hypothetical protein